MATKEQPTAPYRAIGEIESEGLELEAQTQFTDTLSLQRGTRDYRKRSLPFLSTPHESR